MQLTKRDVLKQTTLKTETVDVPEWGGTLTVQEMTAIQRDQFESWVMSQGEGNTKGTRVCVMINTVVDENGKQMFTDLDADDLGKKPSQIIDRVASVGLRLSGMTDDAVEDAAKNSETVQDADSVSDSVEN